MKFFTPELYIEGNSLDDSIADAAHNKWDAEIWRYKDHVEELVDKYQHLKDLVDCGLHDCTYSFTETQGTFKIEAYCSSTNIHTAINYKLWDNVSFVKSADNEVWSKSDHCLLYDEVDVLWPNLNMFVHRILISDGHVLEIPFRAAEVIKPDIVCQIR